jgi:hypothetical protein
MYTTRKRSNGGLLGVILLSSFVAIPLASGQEETGVFRIESIPGCVDLTYPPDAPAQKLYTDVHHFPAARQGGGAGQGGGLGPNLQHEVADPINSADISRDSQHHTEEQLRSADYQVVPGAGGKTLKRDFTIRRHATFTFCVRPTPQLGSAAGGHTVTLKTRVTDLTFAERVSPGKPASQYITQQTADIIDQENAQFRHKVDQAIAALKAGIDNQRVPLESSEFLRLFGSEGVAAKTFQFDFANTPYETTFKLRLSKGNAR